MVNKVILIGNVGADPEIHTFETGNKVARVRVATTERIYNPATTQWGEHTEWHTVVTSSRHSNFVELYVKKGSQVYVEGRLRRREWGEGNDKRYMVEIRADEFRILGRRSDNNASQTDFAAPQQTAAPQQSSYNQPTAAPQQSSCNTSATTLQQPAAAQQPAAPAYNSFQDDQTDDIPF